mmetsp:Transcript_14867/g.29697  ORF Transcript_14867/g.29697 Transcript_14867/m.29697 type:complete len:424 (+) Transcript_14867:106-1377(+)
MSLRSAAAAAVLSTTALRYARRTRRPNKCPPSPPAALEKRTISTSIFTAPDFTETPSNLRSEDSAGSPAIPIKKTLDDLYFIYVKELKRVPTDGSIFPIDDDFFEGKFLPMFHTGDSKSGLGREDRAIEGNIEGGHRHSLGTGKMFEFQFQGRLKKRPEGTLWLAFEIEHPVEISPLRRAVLRTVLDLISRRAGPGNFHYSLGDDPSLLTEIDVRTGNYERPHIALPLERAVDRLTSTEPGRPLPALGTHLGDEQFERCDQDFLGWNTENTFTMALWSDQINFSLWNVLNLPGGIRPFGISSCIGKLPINVVYYSVGGRHNSEDDVVGKRDGRHLQGDLDVYAHYEIGNVLHTEGGYTQRYIDHESAVDRLEEIDMRLVKGDMGASSAKTWLDPQGWLLKCNRSLEELLSEDSWSAVEVLSLT